MIKDCLNKTFFTKICPNSPISLQSTSKLCCYVTVVDGFSSSIISGHLHQALQEAVFATLLNHIARLVCLFVGLDVCKGKQRLIFYHQRRVFVTLLTVGR